MRAILLSLFLLTAAGDAWAHEAQRAQITRYNLTCDVGPITRTIAATKWKAYSCHNDFAVMFVAADGNPMAPCAVFVIETGQKTLVSDAGLCNDASIREVNRRLMDSAFHDIPDIIRRTKDAGD
jgi:hypothetical protein